jgi:hypothetical protein
MFFYGTTYCNVGFIGCDEISRNFPRHFSSMPFRQISYLLYTVQYSTTTLTKFLAFLHILVQIIIINRVWNKSIRTNGYPKFKSFAPLCTLKLLAPTCYHALLFSSSTGKNNHYQANNFGFKENNFFFILQDYSQWIKRNDTLYISKGRNRYLFLTVRVVSNELMC